MLWLQVAQGVVLAEGTGRAGRVSRLRVGYRQEHLFQRRGARSTRVEPHVRFSGLVDRKQRLPCVVVVVSGGRPDSDRGHVLVPGTSREVTVRLLGPEPGRRRATARLTGCQGRKLHARTVAVGQRRRRPHDGQINHVPLFILTTRLFDCILRLGLKTSAVIRGCTVPCSSSRTSTKRLLGTVLFNADLLTSNRIKVYTLLNLCSQTIRVQACVKR